MWRSGGPEHLSTILVSKESFSAHCTIVGFSFYSVKYSVSFTFSGRFIQCLALVLCSKKTFGSIIKPCYNNANKSNLATLYSRPHNNTVVVEGLKLWWSVGVYPICHRTKARQHGYTFRQTQRPLTLTYCKCCEWSVKVFEMFAMEKFSQFQFQSIT